MKKIQKKRNDSVSNSICAVKLSYMAGRTYQEAFEKLSKLVYQMRSLELLPEVLREYEHLEDFIVEKERGKKPNANEEKVRIKALYVDPFSFEDRIAEYYEKYPELKGPVPEPVEPGKLRK